MSDNESSLKKGLVALENHAVFNLTVFIEIQPSPIGALSSLVTIIENPVSLLISDSRLQF